MISADVYVKAFIDNNWLSIAIFLFIVRGVAVNFRINWVAKVYEVLASAYQFIRPGALKVDEGREKK